MILVILESPFAGDTIKNIEYAKKCMFDSLKRGEAPMVSHLLYTQCLDYNIPEQRFMGIDAGLSFGKVCSKTVVYTDLGISKGMQYGIDRAKNENREIEFRKIL